MSVEKIQNTAYIYALQNAIQFDGKATEKAVIGKVIAVLGKEGFTPKEIVPVVRTVVANVNRLPLDKQLAELKRLSPELLQKEKKEREFALPPLPHAEIGKVITRFPPEPNGYLHIGHAKAALIDSEYAKIYDGTFILRFDDTNPENADLTFYEAQKKDLEWLGITWDKEYNTSDNLVIHYKLAEQLIKQGDAYVCDCPPEDVKHKRFHKETCACREPDPKKNLECWKDMIYSSTTQNTILRLRGDLSCNNTTMRDPTLFRIIEAPHPLQGDTYRVWPTYDFAGAVEDSISGVTHPFRTKEYELRDECYFRILDLLKLRKPFLMEFSRLSIAGMPVSKRKIKPLIEKGLVSGYDDVRLPTLQGLKRRGILPEAIKQFVISQGISKVESVVDFSLVEATNRKLVDPQAKRFFFVPHPIKLKVIDAPQRTVKLRLHPTTNLGERIMEVKSIFYISREDMEKKKINDVFRLKSLYNVQIQKITKSEITAKYLGEELQAKSDKIQWTTDDYIPMTVFVPKPLFDEHDAYNSHSLEKLEGFAEKTIESVKDGELIQFERVGFVHIEKQGKTTVGFLTHR